VSDTTQLKNFKKIIVIPVVFTVGVSGEELEIKSIHDSIDSFFGDATNLFNLGIGVLELRELSCSEDRFPIGIKIDGVFAIEVVG
jgi:hypothetical protein